MMIGVDRCQFIQRFTRASGVLLTETEDVALRIFDVEIAACPGSFFEGLDNFSPARLQLAEQRLDTGHGNVRVQMLVLFPVRPVVGEIRAVLEVYRESVTADAGIKRLIRKIDFEAKPVTILRNRSIEILDKKLRSDPRNLGSTTTYHFSHVIARRVMVCVVHQLRQNLPRWVRTVPFHATSRVEVSNGQEVCLRRAAWRAGSRVTCRGTAVPTSEAWRRGAHG